MEVLSYIFKSNVINFILVVLFLYWLLFIKIDSIKFLEDKSKEIIDTIRQAESKKANAIQKLENTKESLKNIDVEMDKIVFDAHNLSDDIRAKSKEKIKKELANIEERTVALEKAHQSKAKEEVSRKVANASILVAKEYIENSLDEASHKELIYNFINDLDNMRVE